MNSEQTAATLFIVATPLGNLSDASARAIETLKGADAILCEDTRVTSKLLAAVSLSKPLLSFHQHSDGRRLGRVLDMLAEGKTLALVTDAGTPGISDPGGVLVAAAVKRFGADLRIVPIPGPSALAAALSVCGFPADAFWFGGFPPHKKGRKTYFDRMAEREDTQVIYESVHRIEKTLEELAGRLPARPVVLCRELTKLYETVYRGTLSEVTEQLKTDTIKGEFVIVIAPARYAR